MDFSLKLNTDIFVAKVLLEMAVIGTLLSNNLQSHLILAVY